MARQRNNFWGINKLSSALFRSWSRPWPWYKGEDGSLQALKNIREKKRKKWGKKNKETRTEFVTVRRQQLSGWKQTPSPSRKSEGGLRERQKDRGALAVDQNITPDTCDTRSRQRSSRSRQCESRVLSEEEEGKNRPRSISKVSLSLSPLRSLEKNQSSARAKVRLEMRDPGGVH